MKKLTYQEAYDKIIQAYFSDQIKPYDEGFCFCGTLCNNDSSWWGKVHLDFAGHMDYSFNDLFEMEKALLMPLLKLSKYDTVDYFLINKDRKQVQDHPDYEEKLFTGMSAALEVLKQIHRERGEDVDSVPAFTKRKLKSAL